MTEVFGITDPELEAIRSVKRYIATSIPLKQPFSPPPPVQDDLATVNRMLSRLATAPPIEEVASRPNGEFPQPEPSDDAGVDRMQWEILNSLLTFAVCPDELKRFVDDALKLRDVHLLFTARLALDNYLGKDDIPF